MKYFLRRVAFFLLALWAAVTLNFLIPRLMPGNPALNLVAQMKGRATPAMLHALELQMGVTNAPMWQQYITYLGQLLHGQLGVSTSRNFEPVSTVIAQSLPWTLGLVGVVTILAFIIGTFIGIVGAWRRNTWVDTSQGISWMFLQSIPAFWLAILFLWVFAYILPWFPQDHSYFSNDTPGLSFHFIGDVLYHAFLPGVVLLITSIGGWMLQMRNNMIQVISDDYVTFAKAKGLRQYKIMMTYASRNAILPNITTFGMALGWAVGGQILIEQIFSYPGIGFQLANAVSSQDYPLAQGTFLIIAIVMLVANLVIDVINGLVDPRVRAGGGM